MKWIFTIITFFIALALADTSSSSSASTLSSGSTSISVTKTEVWATGTDASGFTHTTKSYYSQTFTIYYSSATGTVSSGSVGLGSLPGSVGGIRTYSSVTVSDSGVSLKLNSGYLKRLSIGTTALIAGLPLIILSVFLL